MTNLLAETINSIVLAGQSIDTVKCVRSRDGKYSLPWAQFSLLADFSYDSGYGAQHIAEDLVVEFLDGTYLYRSEYDGSEWWEYNRPLPTLPEDTKPIEKLSGDYWPTVQQIHEGTDEYDVI